MKYKLDEIDSWDFSKFLNHDEIKYFKYNKNYNNNNVYAIHKNKPKECSNTYILDDFDVVSLIPQFRSTINIVMEGMGKNRVDGIANIEILDNGPCNSIEKIVFNFDNQLSNENILPFSKCTDNVWRLLSSNIKNPISYCGMQYSKSFIEITTKNTVPLNIEFNALLLLYPNKLRIQTIRMGNNYEIKKVYHEKEDITEFYIKWYNNGFLKTGLNMYKGNIEEKVIKDMLNEKGAIENKEFEFTTSESNLSN